MSDEGITGDADILQQELPEGVKKEILQDGEAATFMSPQAGDEVTVHYVGRLSDGSEFDSSRARGKAFSFTLGKGQVIQGWDLGVATMRKGEARRGVGQLWVSQWRCLFFLFFIVRISLAVGFEPQSL